MKRREIFSSLVGKNRAIDSSKNALGSTFFSGSGLEKYTGPWGARQAAHLLKRVSFGPNNTQIKQAVNDGLDLTMQKVLQIDPTTSLPMNYDSEDDPSTPLGEAWVGNVFYRNADFPEFASKVKAYRRRSMVGWQIGLLMEKTISIREKMTLFWHNHFPILDMKEPRFQYEYSELLRTNALGNFRELTKKITVNPAILRFLNGRANTKEAPNENYARELLELFTIGKGPIIGPGDYTNYTEEDIKEAAKILTGWTDFGFYAEEENHEVGCEFIASKHDETTKTLSSKFGGKVINNEGDQEYITLINTIFEQDECARYICRKLYRWFLYYEITPEIEASIILPMSQILLENDYDIAPVMKALLESAHFFEDDLIGCQIKNPMDYMTSILKIYDAEVPDDLYGKYTTWKTLDTCSTLLQMTYFNPPSVSGWTSYYQAPGYYQLWINSVTLPQRFIYGSYFVNLGIKIQQGDEEVIRVAIDALDFLNKLDNPSDINAVLDDIVIVLFGGKINEEQKQNLKEILIPGLPDFEWTVEYGIYLDNPGDEQIEDAIRKKVKNLLVAMHHMPEFQLV